MNLFLCDIKFYHNLSGKVSENCILKTNTVENYFLLTLIDGFGKKNPLFQIRESYSRRDRTKESKLVLKHRYSVIQNNFFS